MSENYFDIDYSFKCINKGEKWEHIVDSICLVDSSSDLVFLNYSAITGKITVDPDAPVTSDAKYILKNAYLIEDYLIKLCTRFIRDRGILVDGGFFIEKTVKYKDYFNKNLVRKITLNKILLDEY